MTYVISHDFHGLQNRLTKFHTTFHDRVTHFPWPGDTLFNAQRKMPLNETKLETAAESISPMCTIQHQDFSIHQRRV